MMIEQKIFGGTIEYKLAADSDKKTFSGYGARFDNVDLHGDIIAKGAFAKSLSEHKAAGTTPVMLWNHQVYDIPIGVWLDIVEDDTGLKVAGRFLNSSVANDAYEAVKAGAVTGLSIGFIVTAYEEKRAEDGRRIRQINELKLFEISIVTFPANDLARVSDVKSANDLRDELGKLKAQVADLIAKLADEEPSDNEADDGPAEEFDEPLPDGDEAEAEAKYNRAAITAVEQLILKLKQERDG